MTNNPFTLTFTLQQHTPLIHFQHDHAGATLRATEVKPKLDAFVMERLLKAENITCEKHEIRDKFKGLANGNKPEWAAWLVGKGAADHVALDYKLKIIATEQDNSVAMPPSQDNRQKWQTMFPAFFANMGKDSKEELKNFTWFNHISVEIVTNSKSLTNELKRLFPSFLIHTNFGTRQSKGFGSFYIHPDDPSFKRIALKYSFKVDVERQRNKMDKQNLLFKNIDFFYRSMRSGINLKGQHQSDKIYLKSLMAQYSFRQDSPIQWDKKAIRHHFENGTPPYNKADANRDEDSTFHFQTNKPHRLMRDMLGLSSQESWYAYSDTISKANPEIARFKSPIFFKPLLFGNEFTVYFEAQPIPEEYYGKSFEISHDPRGRRRNPPLTMLLPVNKTEFDLDGFLEFVYSKKDTIEHSIDAQPSGEAEENLLINLYKTLNKHV